MAGGPIDGDAHRAAETAWDVTWPIVRPLVVTAAVLAALNNILFGLIFRRAWPHTGDFELVTSWSGTWLSGVDPYAVPGASIDYTPMGLVLLSPLAWIEPDRALLAWTGVHLVLTAATAWLVSRLAPLGLARPVIVALMLALPPFRIPLQFSLVCFVAALAGFCAASRSPYLAGVAIGVSVFKPQIGGPALMWAIAARQWRVTAAAIGTVAALTGVYALRAGRWPLTIIGDWWTALLREQNDAALSMGETGLEPLLSSSGAPSVSVQLLTAAALAAGLVWIWLRRDDAFGLRLFAAACLVSLLALRHLSYDLLLAIPAIVFALTRERAAVRVLGAAALLVFIASPPSLWRVSLEARAPAILEPLFVHAYRAALAALFACLLLARGGERLQSTSRVS